MTFYESQVLVPESPPKIQETMKHNTSIIQPKPPTTTFIIIDSDPICIDIEPPKKRRLVKKSNIIETESSLTKSIPSHSIEPISLNSIDSETEPEIQDPTYNDLLNFINSCTTEQLSEISSLNKDQTDIFISSRPFENIQSFHSNLCQFKSKSIETINENYKTLKVSYNAVDFIIEKCEFEAMKVCSDIKAWGFHVSNDVSGISFSNEMILFKPCLLLNTKFILKEYQISGVAWLKTLYRHNLGGILADEMGLGKTAQVVSLLASIKESIQTSHHRHLIIVPASLLDNWIREFNDWCPKMIIESYRGTQTERADQRFYLSRHDTEFDVLITTYNMAVSCKEDRMFLRKMRFKSLILDEGHLIKNNNSSRFKNLMTFKVDFRLIITGTPVQNDLNELISLLAFCLPCLFLNESLVDFFQTKCKDLSNQDRLVRAKKMTSTFILRRTKDMVLKELPLKTNKWHYCDMTVKQRQVYTLVKEQTKNKDPQTMNLNNTIMQLRKVANHPLLMKTHYTTEKIKEIAPILRKLPDFREYGGIKVIIEDLESMSDFEIHKELKKHETTLRFCLSDDEILDSSKTKAISEILPLMINQVKKQIIINENDKILLFSQFTIQLDILESVLDLLNITYCRLDGQTNPLNRQNLVDLFNETNISVFLLSTKAGGVGLNLVSANVVILYDLDFNPHNDTQAENRAHRVGQTRPVTVIRMVVKDTIEERIISVGACKLELDEKLKQSENSINREEGVINDSTADMNDEIIDDDLLQLLVQ